MYIHRMLVHNNDGRCNVNANQLKRKRLSAHLGQIVRSVDYLVIALGLCP